jgi:hypothetical protein
MGVLFGTENSQNIIVLVHWLPKVPSLLLIPPFAVRVSELPLDGGGILVVSVLPGPIRQYTCQNIRSGDITKSGSSTSARRDRAWENDARGKA